MSEAGWTDCHDCGMSCEAAEYHPFAACLMFKQCRNSETVRANLQSVHAAGRVAGLREAAEIVSKRQGWHGELIANQIAQAAQGEQSSCKGSFDN